MNINETTLWSVEETEAAENAKNSEKSGNTILVSDISIFTLSGETLKTLLICVANDLAPGTTHRDT